ncbi:hypothetical protein [Mesorhizobium sp. 131-2-1]|uniref:hypothetical protein n=1 Tax=Mesorhizobium sp. 131-2-1 TaxID=2744518 RepID=UPI0019264CA3|nr:hypothetical protein [Mesorhizobium sp. 131-2-1]BCG91426.1 hypothetical protein MesoLj131a_02900 [Mesorhizobium sp. 131-2-1]
MAVVPMPKKPNTDVAKPYEPTERELAVQKAYRKRTHQARPTPTMAIAMSKSDGKTVASISINHPDPKLGFELLSESLAADSEAFLTGTLDALGMVTQRGGTVSEQNMNYALSMVVGMKPRDQLETTLAVQMAAIHIATVNTAASMGGAKTEVVKEGYERALNRLTRTFVAQVEALKRYRSKGEQRVVVERVTVERGGQAIVGTVAQGGGGPGENG